MKTLGICFGATTEQYVKLNVPKAASGGAGDAAKIEAIGRVAHERGRPQGVALRLLSDPALSGVDRVAVTGRAFRSGADRPRLVISSGGETQLVYVINYNIRLGWKRGRGGDGLYIYYFLIPTPAGYYI